ncbi:MAG: adenylyl-sulfate kinase [Spirochaetaceae bacterium]|nr:MAG: adenylyl-sulfate kinase [Spirochaetaceae bacterium]
MQIVIVGHVDHGKSTIVGRLLADTGSLPNGKLDAVRADCARTSKPFEYAFLIDALKDEQAQGITIDSARVFFKSAIRDYIIIDAPGHIEFLKNMVTGASRAEVAFLVIDANEGIQENSRRHGYLLSMLGVHRLSVVVNKMDLVDYDAKTYRRIVRRYRRFLRSISIDADEVEFIPVSGINGDNIVARTDKMPWYTGRTVVEQLDSFAKQESVASLPLRIPVQDVYKFTRFGDSRRIVVGTIATGSLAVGDEVVFYPSGKRSTVASIESFATDPPTRAEAPAAVGFTLTEQIYVTRGQVAVRAHERPPQIANRLRVNLFWLGREPMLPDRDYLFRTGTSRHSVRIHRVERVLNASNLRTSRRKREIERHEVAEVELVFDTDIAFDPVAELPYTSRFVIVDDYEIRGGGIIRGKADDADGWIRENVRLRNFAWDRSLISPVDRAERYNQIATLVVINGTDQARTRDMAHRLEQRLFQDGKLSYSLYVGNVERGVSADIQEVPVSRDEHVRRLGEVAHLFLDAGLILIVSGVSFRPADLDVLRVPVNPDAIVTVHVGNTDHDRTTYDVVVDDNDPVAAVDQIKQRLRRNGAIFSPQ